MIGNFDKPFFALEYVLIGSLAARGAGVSAGGIRALCTLSLTGIHPVGDGIFIGFKVFSDSAAGGGGGGGLIGIDFLITTKFFFATFC